MKKSVENEYSENTPHVSFLNSYVLSMIEDLPEHFVQEYRKLNDNLEQDVKSIVLTHFIEEKPVKDDTFQVIRKVAREETAKLRKRKKYKADQMKKEFLSEYNAAKAGEEVKNSASPFSSATLTTIANVSKQSESVVIEEIHQKFNSWYDKFTASKSQSITINDIVHFIDYEYFYLIASYSKPLAKKLLKLDLEENLFVLSKLDKYINFYNYAPLRKTGMFELTQRRTIAKEGRESYVQFSDGSYLSNQTLDELDFKFISFLTNNGIALGDGTKLEAEGPFVDFLKIAYPGRRAGGYGVSEYNIVRDRLERLKTVRFEKIEFDENSNGKKYKKTGRSISLFDEAFIPSFEDMNKDEDQGKQKRGEYIYRVVLGPAIARAIVSTHMMPVLSGPLERLSLTDDGSSSVIYINICQDRIEDLTKYKQMKHTYSFIEMSLIIRLRDKSKKKKIESYYNALKRLQKEQILIDKVVLEQEKFIVTWLPLTEAENSSISMIQDNRKQQLLLFQNEIE